MKNAILLLLFFCLPARAGYIDLPLSGITANSCSAGQYAYGIADDGTLSCSAPPGAVSSVTASSPLSSTGGSTPNISCQTASGSQAGCLASADWTTFNGKQAAGSYITALTSDVSASGPGSASATVNSVGGSTAANIHTAEQTVNTSTTENYFLAAPNGSNGVMSPRAVVAADIPTLNQNTTGTAQNGFFYLESNSSVYGGTNATLSFTSTDTTVIGPGAGASASLSGTACTFVGYDAGDANTSGASNTFVGSSAGAIITTGANDVAIGAGAAFNANSNQQAVSIGALAAPGTESVGVGYDNLCKGTLDVCIGWEANANLNTNNESVALGALATAGATGDIVVGFASEVGHNNSVVIAPGDSNTGMADATSGTNQFAIGDARTDSYISTMCLGQGCAAVASPKTNFTIEATGASGSNVAGTNLIIQPGNGTGTGGSGAIEFQTAPTAGSSSTANTMATVVNVAASGAVTLGAGSTTPQHAINTSTATASSCGSLSGAAGCIQITINGSTHYVPYY